MRPLGWALIQYDWYFIRRNLDIQRDPRDMPIQRKDHKKTYKEGSHLQTKERELRQNQLCQHFDLGPPACRTVRK
jgi:hypothetical protein